MARHSIPDALAILASSYEADGCPIQAIHCLQALVNQQLPPDFEAKARLGLGRLLLAHTHNFKEACSHLLRAQILARGLIGNYCLKYEVHDQLATCYHYTGEDALELEAYTTVADLWQSAKGSGEWPAVCGWVCRLAQRGAALHARCTRPLEAERAAAAGLAFAEAHGLQQQRVAFLLLAVQLALARWDHDAADRHLAALNSLIAASTTAAAAASGGDGGGGDGAGLGLDTAGYLSVLLHHNLLQVLYMLRLGKVTELNKADPAAEQQHQKQQQQQQQQGTASAAEGDESDGPPPPVLAHLDGMLAQLAALRGQGQGQVAAQQAGRQAGEAGGQGPGTSGGSTTSQPYTLPGLPTLEPLVCLVCATALRAASAKPKLTERYLQRGLACTGALLEAAGVQTDSQEEGLARQAAEAARPALQLQLLLLECRAQILLSKAELAGAREAVLSCQALLERFPGLLRPLLPGVHLLAGQYCVAVGETAAAAAHFQVAHAHAANRSAAAVAAVLGAEAHLASAPPPPTPQQQQLSAEQLQQLQQQQADALARAVAALGSFYTDAIASCAGGASGAAAGAAGGGRSPPLGYFEESACLLASAACLSQQGQLTQANQMLSRALKTAHRRVGHTQLVCCILHELAPTFLAQGDTHSAAEAVTSALTFSRTAGDVWAEAHGKRRLAAILTQQGEHDKAAAAAASAARREARVSAAAGEARSDSGRHGYAAGWGLRMVA